MKTNEEQLEKARRMRDKWSPGGALYKYWDDYIKGYEEKLRQKEIKKMESCLNTAKTIKKTCTCSNSSAVCQQVAPVPTDQKQREYLLGRLSGIHSKKIADLRVIFKMDEDEGPSSFEEFLQRLNDGKYQIKKKYEDESFNMYNIPFMIEWREPESKPDQEGFTKALNSLGELKNKTKDRIAIYEPEEGLKALEEFEANDYEYK